MKKLVLTLALSALALGASAETTEPMISRTLKLAKGWNAVYLELTPETSDPAAFFAFADVTRAGSYQTGAYDKTAQYDSEGNSLNQKPVSYLVWEKGSSASTLKSLTGGHVYLVYAKEAATTEYRGVPALPRMNWLTGESSEGVISLIAPSLEPGVTEPAQSYFAEGPWDRKSVYRVLGTTESAPTFLSDISAKPKVTAGLGYALTGTSNARWAGVIDVQNNLFFDKGETKASVMIRNAGTTNHTFRIALEAAEAPEGIVLPKLSLQDPVTNAAVAATWSPFTTDTPREITLARGEAKRLVFALDRSVLKDVTKCGAILSVKDLSGTEMSVRAPVYVDPAEDPEVVAFPAGTWVGTLSLSHVTRREAVHREGETNTVYAVDAPMTAMVIAKVDTNGVAKLMQHAETPSGGRAITVFLSATTPEIVGTGKFGDYVDFDWTLDKDARDNPFRHAHHPDHASGKTIGNAMRLAWNNKDEKMKFVRNEDETTVGVVTWSVIGLTSEEIKTLGVFSLKRIQ